MSQHIREYPALRGLEWLPIHRQLLAVLATLRELHLSELPVDKELDWDFLESGMFGLSELVAMINRDDLKTSQEVELSQILQKMGEVHDRQTASEFVCWVTDLYVEFGNKKTISAQEWGEWGMKQLEQRALALQSTTIEADRQILERGLQRAEAETFQSLLTTLEHCFCVVVDHILIHKDHAGAQELLMIADQADFWSSFKRPQDTMGIRQKYEQEQAKGGSKMVPFMTAGLSVIKHLREKRSTIRVLFALKHIAPLLPKLYNTVLTDVPIKYLVDALTEHGLKPAAKEFLAQMESRRQAAHLDARDMLQSPAPSVLGRELATAGLERENARRAQLLRKNFGKGVSDIEDSPSVSHVTAATPDWDDAPSARGIEQHEGSIHTQAGQWTQMSSKER